MIRSTVLNSVNPFYLKARGFSRLSKRELGNSCEKLPVHTRVELLHRFYWVHLRGLLAGAFAYFFIGSFLLRAKLRPTLKTAQFRLLKITLPCISDFHFTSKKSSSRLKFPVSSALIVLLTFTCTGCSGLSYLLQAGKGQLALINHARPIQEVLKDEKVSPRIRVLLAEIAPIKQFGEIQGLKPTHNYTDFVNLDRPAAVWVVSASRPLQFEAKEWSFPCVGSFPYLGWFDRIDAQNFSKELEAEGWDVDLRGARAYSTLGWFKDAVLSTMIPDGAEALGELVNVVLHESVHATVYIKGQSYFNESLASFIADRLTTDYLSLKKGPKSKEKIAYETAELSGRANTKLQSEAYAELSKIFDSNLSADEKKQKKAQVYARLKVELKIKRAINNATLIQYKTYNTGDADFQELLIRCDFDWSRFLGVMKHLKSQSFTQSQQETIKDVLAAAVGSNCSQASTLTGG
jgi:predicted aminopeptidase